MRVLVNQANSPAVAEAMGVSTTPAREALGRVTADGGLEYTGPKTMRVPVLSHERFDELQDVRIALESLIADPDDERARRRSERGGGDGARRVSKI